MSSTQEVGEIFGSGAGPAHAMLRSPTVLIASIGLWGMNVYFFRLFGIDYVKVLKYDLDEEKKQAEELLHNNNSSGSHGHSGGCHPSSNSSHGIGGKPSSSSSSAAVVSSRHNKNSLSGGSALATTADAGAVASSNSMDFADPDEDSDDDYYHDDPESSPLFDARGIGMQHHPVDAVMASSSITWGRLVGFSLSLLVLLHATYGFWIDVLGRSPLSAVFAFYGAVTTAVVLPLPSTKWLRRAVVIVLQRSFELINPRCNCILLDANSNNLQQQPFPVLPRAIPFVDVFFADAMCSLSKVFFDWGMLLHMAAHYPNPVPPSALNIVIPSAFAAVPFVIRARQCLIMYQIGRLTCQPTRFSHLANAVKYSTSIFPLIVSAYQKTVSAAASASLEPLLILLLVINALYALYWDVVMDWGLLQNPTAVCKAATIVAAYPTSSSSSSGTVPGSAAANVSSPSGASTATNPPLVVSSTLSIPTTMASSVSATSSSVVSLSSSKHHHLHHHHLTLGGHLRQAATTPICHHLMRPKLRFGIVMSALIVLADSVLRFSWTLRFYHSLFPSGDSFVLCTQFLEVFRRALWNLLRIEWEHMRQRVRQRQSLLALKKKNRGMDDASSIVMANLGVGSSSNNGDANVGGMMGSGTPSGSHHGPSGSAIVVGCGAGAGGGGIGGGGVVASTASELTSYLLHPGKRPKEATA
jgi:hypothetical protein